MEHGADQSALVRRSGSKITVALSYEDLEQKVYSPNIRTDDSSVLDLRGVTGCVASKQLSHASASKPSSGASAKTKVPANTNKCDASSSLASEPGDKMPDGTAYGGVSPDTGKSLYAMPADASLTMTFNEAQKYAQDVNAQNLLGYNDWRVPTKDELQVLFNNRAEIGGFDVSGSYPSGWYWSSFHAGKWGAWGQRFSDGLQRATTLSSTTRPSACSAERMRSGLPTREEQ